MSYVDLQTVSLSICGGPFDEAETAALARRLLLVTPPPAALQAREMQCASFCLHWQVARRSVKVKNLLPYE